MNSPFDLITNIDDVGSLNLKMSKYNYYEKSADRALTGDTFPSTNINYEFEIGSNERLDGYHAVIDCELEISIYTGVGQATRVPVKGDNIAPCMGAMNCLWDEIELTNDNVEIGNISKNIPQVAAMRARSTYSDAWMEGVGNSTNFWSANFSKRQELICADSKTDDGDNQNASLNLVGNRYEALIATRLGFDAAATIAIAAVGVAVGAYTQILTLVQGAGDDLIEAGLRPGDRIKGVAGAALNFEYEFISFVPGADILVAIVKIITGDKTAVIAATTMPNWEFYRPDSRQPSKSTIRCLWKPPIGAFYMNHPWGPGKWNLRLKPRSADTYQKLFFESKFFPIEQTAGVAGNIRLQIKRMTFMMPMYESERFDEGIYHMAMQEIDAHTQTVSGTGRQEYSQRISPSTQKVTLAFQTNDVETLTTASPSVFKFNNMVAGAATAGVPSTELTLRNFYLKYGTEQYPQPQPSLQYEDPFNFWSKVYQQSKVYEGSFYDEGAGETFRKWLQRGPYFSFLTARDGTSRERSIDINFDLPGETVPAGSVRYLLFDHYRKIVSVEISGGQVQSVKTQMA